MYFPICFGLLIRGTILFLMSPASLHVLKRASGAVGEVVFGDALNPTHTEYQLESKLLCFGLCFLLKHPLDNR